MSALISNPEAWIALGLILFFALLGYFRVHHLAAGQLDARGAKIRDALAEAESLRAEAQAMLADLKHKREAAEADAAHMLTDARAEAQRMEIEAHRKLDEQLARRTQLAERRIALAETQATAEVKRAAAELAAAAAGGLLARRLASAGADPSADHAIAGLQGKLQ